MLVAWRRFHSSHVTRFTEWSQIYWIPVTNWKSQQITKEHDEEPGGRFGLEKITTKVEFSVDGPASGRREGKSQCLEDKTVEISRSE